MECPEYMSLKIADIPEEINVHYNMSERASDEWLYVKIELGTYGLPQTADRNPSKQIVDKTTGQRGKLQMSILTRPMVTQDTSDDLWCSTV